MVLYLISASHVSLLYIWVLTVKLTLCCPSGSWNYETAHRFSENLCTYTYTHTTHLEYILTRFTLILEEAARMFLCNVGIMPRRPHNVLIYEYAMRTTSSCNCLWSPQKSFCWQWL